MQLNKKVINIVGWVLTGLGFAISIADSELTRKEQNMIIDEKVTEAVGKAVEKLNK